MPSPSPSSWPGLASSGQLSSPFGMPSPSESSGSSDGTNREVDGAARFVAEGVFGFDHQRVGSNVPDRSSAPVGHRSTVDRTDAGFPCPPAASPQLYWMVTGDRTLPPSGDTVMTGPVVSKITVTDSSTPFEKNKRHRVGPVAELDRVERPPTPLVPPSTSGPLFDPVLQRLTTVCGCGRRDRGGIEHPGIRRTVRAAVDLIRAGVGLVVVQVGLGLVCAEADVAVAVERLDDELDVATGDLDRAAPHVVALLGQLDRRPLGCRPPDSGPPGPAPARYRTDRSPWRRSPAGRTRHRPGQWTASPANTGGC